MNSSIPHFKELQNLMELLCEQRLSEQESARLEQLLQADQNALNYYIQYIQLHGSLYWDAAQGMTDVTHTLSASSHSLPAVKHLPRQAGKSRGGLLVVAMSCLALLLIGWIIQYSLNQETELEDTIVENDRTEVVTPAEDIRPSPNQPSHPAVKLPQQPPRLVHNNQPGSRTSPAELPSPPVIAIRPTVVPLPVVDFINERVQTGWVTANVNPSVVATDAEWLRRVYLDLAGHIPPLEVTKQFLKSTQPNKREALVNSLLEEPAYANHFSTIWTNLLIGRSFSRDVDREALQHYLQESFSGNRSWSQIATDLISAEGDASSNGATNFLLAHLNNQAVPATAITARLFLGTQVQCTQCHDHPFNDWKQNQFWELNCFFKQTMKVKGKSSRKSRFGIARCGWANFL